ncbi:hypothetical protein HUT16_36240 [Kitasatospora sp. NA04385]|uniref:hypothetical protein n=1 Tax=Kitasatospora sp. NA04385 TaxID=2742135 RepID=UPI001590388B|nr:hypothetical protein [Kitasatospora sp. NA04385]QKW23831.1 hypothetical protein HUT16_36240 [Kitasatospora sp. NA04385]
MILPAAPPAPPAPPTAAPYQAAAPGLPPAPPAPPTAPPGAPAHSGTYPGAYPGLPPTGAPVDPAVLAKRKRIALGVGAVVVVSGLILLGSTLFGGDSVPTLPRSVEGEKMRASSANGDFPDWKDMSSSMTKMGVRDVQGAVYGSVPEAEADEPINGDDRKERWSVVIGKSSPEFRAKMAVLVDSSGDSDAPHVVESGLGGTMYCDSYDPDDSKRTRARKDITCLWADDDYMIVVVGTGVDENLPPKVLERVRSGDES